MIVRLEPCCYLDLSRFCTDRAALKTEIGNIRRPRAVTNCCCRPQFQSIGPRDMALPRHKLWSLAVRRIFP